MKEMKLTVAVCTLIAKLIFSLTIVSAQIPISENRTHGESCGPYDHCRMNAGLICTDGACACSSGRVSDKYGYDLEWVVSAGRCQSRLNSVCIGTAEAPAAPNRIIECLGAGEGRTRCVQVTGLPFGVGVCQPPSQALHPHGQPCSETIHCDAAAGLICSLDSKICSCTSGHLTDTYSYNLRWDNAKARCVGNVGSACVGTRETPLTTLAKRIECVTDNGCISVGPASSAPKCTLSEVHCQQIPGLPLGIGFCKENLDQVQETTTTTTATASPTPTTTTTTSVTSSPLPTTTSSAPSAKTASSSIFVTLTLAGYILTAILPCNQYLS